MSKQRILVLVERQGTGISALGHETLVTGRRLAEAVQGSLCAVVLGHEIYEIVDLVAYWTDQVLYVDNPVLAQFQSDIWTDVMDEVLQRCEHEIVLFGHTLDNQSLAPKIAARRKTEVLTDCIALEIAGGHLLGTKQVYGGNASVTFEVENRPAIATLRPGVVEGSQPSCQKGEIISLEINLAESVPKTELLENVAEESVSLDSANAIVSGGRGLGKAEGTKALFELAEALKQRFEKVEVGGSRPATDAGWLANTRQIGLTGEKVNPELYVAIGISGVSQHLVGITGSKKIVAINSDPQAAIFKYADYGVVDRYEDFVPCLIQKLKEAP